MTRKIWHQEKPSKAKMFSSFNIGKYIILSDTREHFWVRDVSKYNIVSPTNT